MMLLCKMKLPAFYTYIFIHQLVVAKNERKNMHTHTHTHTYNEILQKKTESKEKAKSSK